MPLLYFQRIPLMNRDVALFPTLSPNERSPLHEFAVDSTSYKYLMPLKLGQVCGNFFKRNTAHSGTFYEDRIRWHNSAKLL